MAASAALGSLEYQRLNKKNQERTKSRNKKRCRKNRQRFLFLFKQLEAYLSSHKLFFSVTTLKNHEATGLSLTYEREASNGM
jgi:hypothetical protein